MPSFASPMTSDAWAPVRDYGCAGSAHLSAFNVAGDPDASVPLTELAEQERLLIRTVFTGVGATFPFGTHVAVAEVDTETGKATLLRVITVDDAGVVLNPLLAEGQRHEERARHALDRRSLSAPPLHRRGAGDHRAELLSSAQRRGGGALCRAVPRREARHHR